MSLHPFHSNQLNYRAAPSIPCIIYPMQLNQHCLLAPPGRFPAINNSFFPPIPFPTNYTSQLQKTKTYFLSPLYPRKFNRNSPQQNRTKPSPRLRPRQKQKKSIVHQANSPGWSWKGKYILVAIEYSNRNSSSPRGWSQVLRVLGKIIQC